MITITIITVRNMITVTVTVRTIITVDDFEICETEMGVDRGLEEIDQSI